MGIPRLRVLVVGNDSIIDDVLVCLRTGLECDVVVVRDVVDAAVWLKRGDCDVAFLDAELPDGAAFELARCARRSPANSGISLVMIPGDDFAATVAAGAQARVDFYIAKPISQRQVLGMLRFAAASATELRKRAARAPDA